MKDGYRLLVLPDIQFPYHDQKTFNAIYKYLREAPKFDECLQLGDFMDFSYISKWTKGNLRFLEGKRFLEDYTKANKFLDELMGHLRANNKQMKFTMLQGNHDIRPEVFMDVHPEMEGMLEMEENLRFKERGIDYRKTWNTFETYKVGHAEFIHGGYITKYHAAKMVEQYQAPIFYGHCFDEQTELLTKDGWKTYERITEEDVCLTMNKDTNLLEWNRINKKFVYDAPDTMVQIKSTKVDLLVDKEHGLVYRSPRSSDWTYGKAKDLLGMNTNYVFKVAGTEDEGTEYPIDDNTLKLLAWIISEGTVYKIGNTPYVEIAQSKESDVNTICDVLDAVGMEYSLSPKEATEHSTMQPYRFRLLAESARIVYPFVADKSRVPEWARLLSNRQFTVFVDEYIKGDGSAYTGRHKNQRAIYTNKQEWVDYFQERLFRTGYRTRVYWRTGGFGNKPCAQINIFGSQETHVHARKHIKEVPYSGKMWCVNVDNGTLVVRRGDKIVVTQNTHDVMCYPMTNRAKHKAYVGQSLGCLCVYDMDYMGKRPSNWQQAFAEFVFTKDGHFNYNITRIFNHSFVHLNGKMYHA